MDEERHGVRMSDLPDIHDPIKEFLEWWDSQPSWIQCIILIVAGIVLVVAGILIIWFLKDKPVGDVWFIFAALFIIAGAIALTMAYFRCTEGKRNECPKWLKETILER